MDRAGLTSYYRRLSLLVIIPEIRFVLSSRSTAAALRKLNSTLASDLPPVLDLPPPISARAGRDTRYILHGAIHRQHSSE